MSIINYSAERMNMLKQTLINSSEAGKPSDYEIRVDDMKVVPRTNDTEHFDNYEDFVTEETKKVVVLVYDGTSRRNTRHTFQFKDEKKQKAEEKTLNGTEVQKIVSDELEKEKKQWKYELMEKENKELKKKIEEADEHFSKLSAHIEDLKSKRKVGDMQWGELFGVAGEAILRRNTHLLAKVPGMQGLAGIIEKDNKEQEKQIASPEPEVQASFSKIKSEEESSNEEGKEKNENENSSFSQEDKAHVDFLRQLQTRFSKEQLKQIITLLNMFVDKPEAIEPAIILTLEWNEKPETRKQDLKPETKTEQQEEIKAEVKQEKSEEKNETPSKISQEEEFSHNTSY